MEYVQASLSTKSPAKLNPWMILLLVFGLYLMPHAYRFPCELYFRSYQMPKYSPPAKWLSCRILEVPIRWIAAAVASFWVICQLGFGLTIRLFLITLLDENMFSN